MHEHTHGTRPLSLLDGLEDIDVLYVVRVPSSFRVRLAQEVALAVGDAPSASGQRPPGRTRTPAGITVRVANRKVSGVVTDLPSDTLETLACRHGRMGPLLEGVTRVHVFRLDRAVRSAPRTAGYSPNDRWRRMRLG